MMHIYVEQITKKSHTPESTESDYDVMKSMLQSISELTMPLKVVDGLIEVLKIDIVTLAGSIGHNVCDILEHVADSESIRLDDLIDEDASYAQLVDELKYLKRLLQYRDAVIRAGGK